MQTRLRRVLASLDMEERILNGASLFALISVFFPWLSGELIGDDSVSYSGFHFFTAFIGTGIFLLHIAILSFTVVPAVGGPMMGGRRSRDFIRLCLAAQATILSLAALSVLTRITYDYARMEVRFGIYCTFIGSLIAGFYAFWRWQQMRKHEHGETFHHPEDHELHDASSHESISSFPPPPPPPPPPPLQPENHRIHP
jgi:hypothetical protein